MSDKKDIEVHKKSSTNTILVGALVGAGAGLVAALLIQRRAKKQERDTMLTMSEGIQLGLLVFGLFRAISAMGADEK